MSRFLIPVLCAIAVAAISFESSGQSPVLNDPVSKLERQIARGEVKLEFSRGGWGWLPSLLRNLDLNIDSQVLVFSKTSFQLKQISPRTPRALFVNDSVAIGSVQGGEVFEVTSLDPDQGVIYYTLRTRETAQPQFERQFEKCLNCHGPAQGLVVSSVFPGADGTPFITSNCFGGIDHSTPFDNRWGGWYVSGTHGSQRHMGNAVVHNSDSRLDLEEEGTQNLTSLAEKFDTTKYLAPTSDIVVLMTLDHQAHMTNRIISLGQ